MGFVAWQPDRSAELILTLLRPIRLTPHIKPILPVLHDGPITPVYLHMWGRTGCAHVVEILCCEWLMFLSSIRAPDWLVQDKLGGTNKI